MTTPENDAKAATDQSVSRANQLVHRLSHDPQFIAQFAEMAVSIAGAMAGIRERLAPLAAAVAAGLVRFQADLARVAAQIAPSIEALHENLRRLPETMRRAVLVLAQESWFISPNMPISEPLEAAALLLEGKTLEAEESLVRFFEPRLEAIEATLTAALPARAKVIAAAFNAHREGKFELSIPVLLAQTDGLCLEIAKGAFFMSDRGKRKGARRPETAVFVESIESDMLWSALLGPLGLALPINYTASEREDDFVGLNRHLVMHGESTDYGTRVNSLKCISLLSYAEWVLRDSTNMDLKMPGPKE